MLFHLASWFGMGWPREPWQVLDVTSFLGDHPGGELAILTFAGKDATEEFNMWLGEEDFFVFRKVC